MVAGFAYLRVGKLSHGFSNSKCVELVFLFPTQSQLVCLSTDLFTLLLHHIWELCAIYLSFALLLTPNQTLPALHTFPHPLRHSLVCCLPSIMIPLAFPFWNSSTLHIRVPVVHDICVAIDADSRMLNDPR